MKKKKKILNHIQNTCTSADPGENVQSFKNTGLKLYGKLQSQGTTVYTSEVRK